MILFNIRSIFWGFESFHHTILSSSTFKKLLCYFYKEINWNIFKNLLIIQAIVEYEMQRFQAISKLAFILYRKILIFLAFVNHLSICSVRLTLDYYLSFILYFFISSIALFVCVWITWIIIELWRISDNFEILSYIPT